MPKTTTHRFYSGKRWQRLRALVRQRDGEACQACGLPDRYVKADGKTVRLSVHHRDGDRTNNDMANLITLCLQCHGRLDGGKSHGGRGGGFGEIPRTYTPRSVASLPGAETSRRTSRAW